MFTGIIETQGEVVAMHNDGDNTHFTISSPISAELKIDQSLSHNGVCLTVVGLGDAPQSSSSAQNSTQSSHANSTPNQVSHTVTAVRETLTKSSLGDLKIGDRVNLERAMKIGDRLDGHMVQGHVDGVGECISVEEEGGSWRFTFSYPTSGRALVVEKGSICLDGVSLTLVDVNREHFSVAIIPYTYEHTRFSSYKIGDKVNLEFDIIGKYVQQQTAYINQP